MTVLVVKDTAIVAELKSSSETVGQDALKFLGVLKKEKPGSGNIAASANDVQKAIRQLERLAGVGLVMILYGALFVMYQYILLVGFSTIG